MNRITLRATAAMFVVAAAPVHGQQPLLGARGFFESARNSIYTADSAPLQPAAGTAMRTLTQVQTVDNLRTFLATADTATLFPKTDNTAATAAGDKLRRVLRDPSLQTAQLVSFDLRRMEASALKDAPLRICTGAEPYCSVVRTRRFEELGGGIQRIQATIGGTEGKPHGQAIFIRQEGTVNGVLNVGSQTYLMRPLGNDVFVITTTRTEEVERSKNDVLDLEQQPTQPGGSAAPDAPSSAVDNCPNPATLQTLDLLAMWTEKARIEALDAGYDVGYLIRHAEAIGDRTFQNSQINGRFRVTLGGETKYAESGDFETDVRELLKEGGTLQDVRNARRSTKADVAVLIVDHPDPRNCGMAAGIRVSKEKAFAVVNWKCITDKYSFIHEVGHLAGAWHDPRTVGPGAKVQPPYAHGYVTSGKNPLATIMAYRDSCHSKCGRGWYWSNPFIKTEDGQVLGTPDKSFDACVWRQRLPVMVTFDGG